MVTDVDFVLLLLLLVLTIVNKSFLIFDEVSSKRESDIFINAKRRRA
jgi:hypothetical protein